MHCITTVRHDLTYKEDVEHVHICMLHLIVPLVFITYKEVLFGSSHGGSLFANEEQKNVGLWCIL